jgi:hypothetical protein
MRRAFIDGRIETMDVAQTWVARECVYDANSQ